MRRPARPRALAVVEAVLIAMLATSALPAYGQQTTPQLMKVQGHLTDNGQAVTGTVTMDFALYDAAFPVGTLVGTAGPYNVEVGEGVYEVALPFSANAFGGPDRYLEIRVNGEALTPRMRIASAPYSFVADTLDGLDSTAFVKTEGGTMTGPLVVAGRVTSTSGGFAFPDGTVQTTAATGSGGNSGDNVRVDGVQVTDANFVSGASVVFTLDASASPDEIGASIVPGSVGPGEIDRNAGYAWTGTHSFSNNASGVGVARLNDVYHSNLFPSVASALQALPPAGGVLAIDPTEDDPTGFADTNPTTASTGKKDALVIDTRSGGFRVLSSAPEYPSGTPGVLEDRVPFVFQVRRDDPSRVFDDEAGAIGEWNCASSVGSPDAWKNCPNGGSSWGLPGGTKQFWHSGQCNVALGMPVGPSAQCGGPAIFQVRYPQVPGTGEVDKPILSVGHGGMSLHAPGNPSPQWRSWLTMFRGDPFDAPGKENTPMYSFDRDGAFFDGGLFIGATLAWPSYTNHTYSKTPTGIAQWNAYIQHDIDPRNPTLILEGTSNGSFEGETGPMATFYDRADRGTYAHPSGLRAFEFRNNSVLYLGSKCAEDADGCVGTADDSQYIEWEGMVGDAHQTKLTVAEPTADRNVKLPNASGTVVVSSGSSS